MEPQQPNAEASDAQLPHATAQCQRCPGWSRTEGEGEGTSTSLPSHFFKTHLQCLCVLLTRLTCSLPPHRFLLQPRWVSPLPSKALQAVAQGPPLPPPLSITSNVTTPTSQRKRRRTKGGSSLPPLGLRHQQQFKFLGGQRFPMGMLMSREHNEQPL